MKVKVIKCSNAILWYNKHIGEEFDVEFIEDKAYWVREKDPVFNSLNWIYADDSTVTEGNIK
jgi:hypothetical protein